MSVQTVQDQRRTNWFDNHFAKKISNLDDQINEIEGKLRWARNEVKTFNTDALRNLIGQLEPKLRKLKAERLNAIAHKNR